jgi:hypothetical protein
MVALTASFSAVSLLAHAADCSPTLSTAQLVVCLQDQNAVLQQRLSNAQIEHSLSRLDGDAKRRDLGLPSVSAIFGRGGQLHAMLVWNGAHGPSGSLDVVSGAMLPGGLRVARIQPGRVVLIDGHHTHVLLMSGGGGGDGAVAGDAPAATATSPMPLSPAAIPSIPAKMVQR